LLSENFSQGLASKIEDVALKPKKGSMLEPFPSENFDRGLVSKVEDVELKPKKNPTPLITRFGWMFLAMLLALLVIAVAVDQSR
jgi:hypothetical protein